jgi:filamentous hemagglutinin
MPYVRLRDVSRFTPHHAFTSHCKNLFLLFLLLCISLCIPPLCYGQMVVVNVNASQSKIKANTQAANEQSGLKAGDGGFQVNVGGNTSLTGAVISSTQVAVDGKDKDGKALNSFTTGGTLTTTDLQNTSKLDAQSISVSVGYGGGSTSGSAGYGQVKDSQSATMRSGISGITNVNGQSTGNSAARTGDSAQAQGLINPVFNAATDADKVNKSLTVQTGITAQFGQNASKAVGDYGSSKLKEAQSLRDQAAQLQASGNEQDQAQAQSLLTQANNIEAAWKEGGTARVAAHAIVGGLTGGNLSAALSAGASAISAPAIDDYLKQSGVVDDSVRKALVAIGSTASGALVGGVSGSGGAVVGAATGFNQVENNYLKHNELDAKTKQLAACKTTQCTNDVNAYWNNVSQTRDQTIKDSCLNGNNDTCHANINEMQQDMAALLDRKNTTAYGLQGFAPGEKGNLGSLTADLKTNLTELQQRGNATLGTTYSGTADIVKSGAMTTDEVKLLTAINTNDLVNIVGAIALQGGGGKAGGGKTNTAGPKVEEPPVVPKDLQSGSTTNAGAGRAAAANDANVNVSANTRPTPGQSELDVGANLPPGARPQVSYRDGQEVPYGTPGSVRPDWCVGTTCSVEVKNYNVATNSNGLINNVSQQALDRAANLPAGMTQTVVIDVRGQTLTAQQEFAIRQAIVVKSNGAISPNNITFKK